jgi:hypothetical protein
MKKIAYLTMTGCFALLSTLQAQVKPADYRQRIALLQQNIQTYFYDSANGYYKEFNIPDPKEQNKYCYLWPLCALIQGAAETEAAQLAAISTKSVLKAVHAYDDNRPPAPAYASYITQFGRHDRFYDDNQWIGIASMNAYARTHDKSYLQEGIKIYTYMMTGYDTVSGGGLYWKEGDHSTKNTCSNGPGIVLALELYKATKDKTYLEAALSLYKWTNAHLLAPEGVYYDNVQLPAGTIDKRTYTYNTGTMLESNVLLYEATKNKQYLTEAKRLAAGAYAHFFKKGRYPGNYWFNAVLLRGYLALYRHDKESRYLQSFITDANAVWETEKDEKGLIGKKQQKALIDQGAMLEIYARLMKVKGI